jgi:gliding motility-associated-like protein
MGIYSQTQIERSVIGSSGSEGSGSAIQISFTVGETAVATNQNNIVLTEGFQQPLSERLVSFTIEVQNASCREKRNGSARIDSIRGCNAPYTILWSAGATSDSSLAANLGEGDYSVQVISNDGCESGVVPFTIGLEQDVPCLLKFYSGITPNNDGINDAWIIDNIDVFPKNEVNIYNRLGNKVWQGIDYDNDNTLWKGQNLRGNDLPSDTYFYVFEANGDVEKGWIELTR